MNRTFRQRIPLYASILFWSVVFVSALRGFLMLGPITYHWTNLRQESAVFHWSSPPIGGRHVAIDRDDTRTLLITTPRGFTRAVVRIGTYNGTGRLQASVEGVRGGSPQVTIVDSGTPLELALRWSDIAVRNRTFNLSLKALDDQVELEAMALTITER